MLKKLSIAFVLVSILFLAFSPVSRCQTQASPPPGWQVQTNGNGYYSESNGVYRLWCNGGSDCPSIALYEGVEPNADFNFSVQVNAATIESGSIFLRASSDAGGTDGVNLEFGYYGEGVFQLSGNFSGPWTPVPFAYGDPDTWYTMQLSVHSSPFSITSSVFDANGILLGSWSESETDNFTFQDIKYVGFDVWGFQPVDYSFRDISNTLDNQTSLIPTNLSIFADAVSATAGSPVNIFGTLTDSNGTALENRTIVLSYTFLGVDTWIPISSATTDEQGDYSIQWVNTASGTFTLKTEWDGDSAYAAVSNTTSLSFVPCQNQDVFVIQSNSTITALTFDNQTSTLSFNVTGPSGTTGFVKATIAKSLLPNSENLQAQLDGSPLNYTVTLTGDSWIFTFNYHHSTHQITIHFTANQVTTQPFVSNILLIVIVAILGTALAFATRYLIRTNKDSKK